MLLQNVSNTLVYYYVVQNGSLLFSYLFYHPIDSIDSTTAPSIFLVDVVNLTDLNFHHSNTQSTISFSQGIGCDCNAKH